MASSAAEEAGVKGVYAIASMVRNLPQARAAFLEAGESDWGNGWVLVDIHVAG